MKTILKLVPLLLFVSTCVYAQFPRNQKIVDGEYFINTDPGQGLATHINGTYNLWQVVVDVPNLNVPVGSRIYVRFKNSNGTWSAPRAIVKPSEFQNRGATLEYAEYFINSDPGRGHGTQLAIGSGGVLLLNHPRLSRGDKVFFRVMDSFNRWTASRPAVFNFKNMLTAEYYIKYRGGGQSTPDSTMRMSAPNDSNCVFVATKESVTYNYPLDTLFVRFLTSDRFYSKWTREPVSIVAVGDGANGIPKQYALYQNYPNPFNPTSIIRYDLPKSSFVTLKVYDVLGREVGTLVNERQEPGVHQVNWQASGFASGVYFYRLQSGGFVQTKKLILVR
jgi:hypothetical protein